MTESEANKDLGDLGQNSEKDLVNSDLSRPENESMQQAAACVGERGVSVSGAMRRSRRNFLNKTVPLSHSLVQIF